MKATRKTKRTARRLYRLCQVAGQSDAERVRLVARRTAESGRRGTLAILGELLRLVRLDRDEHRALVESATPLAEDVRNDIQTGLARLYGPELDTSFEINPQLIGGVRIQIGSDVYDGSVRAKLAALEARL